MAPVKRKAREPSKKSLQKMAKLKLEEMTSVGTQTDAIKINSLNSVQQLKKFARPKTKLVQQQKWPEEKNESVVPEMDKLNTRNKACQTQKVGVKRLVSENQMGSLKALMIQRRKVSHDRDCARLQILMEQINCDPPPKWHEACKIWLDVDTLEKRIEEFRNDPDGYDADSYLDFCLGGGT